MVGSTFSIAGPNIVLNTAVAEVLRQFADTLEQSDDFTSALSSLVRDTYRKHKRIIFNGNNYSDEWVVEAERRGLSNLKTTVDALPRLVSEKSIDLFTKHRVFTETEIHSRYEILLESYCKTLNIEALAMVDIAKGRIIPACLDYQNELIALLEKKKSCGGYDISVEEYLLDRIVKQTACLLKKLISLESVISESSELRLGKEQDILAQAVFYRDQICAAMAELRLIADELETLVANKHWPLPSYAHLLYSVI